MFVSTSSAITSFPRLLLSLGVDSHLKLKQSYISVPHSSNSADGGTDRPPLQSINIGCTTINLAPGATLDHTYAQELSGQIRCPEDHHLLTSPPLDRFPKFCPLWFRGVPFLYRDSDRASCRRRNRRCPGTCQVEDIPNSPFCI